MGSALVRVARERSVPVHALTRRSVVSDGAIIHYGDARVADLGLDHDEASDLAAHVKHLVFCAGPVDLEAGPREAHTSHVVALRSTLDFARKCPQLRSFVLLSSLVALGDVRHTVSSDYRPSHPRHRNFYEWAKYEQERLACAHDVPVQIVRAGHVLNSTDGELRTHRPSGIFEAFAFLATRWPVPVAANARYWCVPVDLLAQIVLAVADTPTPHGSVWAVDPAAPTYGQVLDVVALRLGLGTRRFRATTLTERIASLLPVGWLGGTLPRPALLYAHAEYDLDLRCLEDVVRRHALDLPETRSYVTHTIDHEFERAAMFA